MAVNHGGAMDYEAMVGQLEAELQAGRARHAAWAAEESELLSVIAGLRKVMARRGGRQIPLPMTGPGMGGPIQPGTFQGLSYRSATRRYFEMMGRPLKAPEVADGLFQAGYAKERKLIKTNIDTIFKKLRDEGVIRRLGEEGSAYELVTNGAGRKPSTA